jgi:hemolysin activation/secretion protein
MPKNPVINTRDPEEKGTGMKTRILIGGVAAVCLCASAQDQRIAPKTPPAKPPATAIAETPVDAAASEEVLVPPLKAIIIVPSLDAVKPEGVPGAQGVQVLGPDFLKRPDFESLLTPYLGQSLSLSKIKKLQRDVILFCRQMDHPVIDAFYPEQDSTEGIIQMAVLEGKVGNITVQNEGIKWFPDSVFTNGVRLQRGGYILESQLLEDINWLNRNSYFRDVEVAFSQGELGEVDLQLRVKDRPPVRPYVGYENSGNEILGEDRLLAGVNLGDVLGLDHLLNYQFTTDVEIEKFKAHSLSYIVPLPWRHTLTVFGSYVDIDTDLAALGFPDFQQEGQSYQASMRYSVPLPRFAKVDHELSAGFDYKRTDNNLEFGVVSLFDTPTEIGQFVVGYRAWRPDPFGSTALGLQGYYSPGDLFSHNDDDDFDATRPGTDANYLYLRVLAERATKLPLGPDWRQKRLDEVFAWHIAGTYQWADSQLLPSEQLGLGGYATVRGYDERVVNGDDGWVINNELRSPAYRIGNLTGKAGAYDTLQFLIFSDYGAARSPEADFDLVSVGGGVRFNVSTHFQFRFDYGWQLTDKGLSSATTTSGKDSRAHLAALLSF